MSEVEANDYIKHIPYIIPFITLLIGAWIGNRNAINKDRRAEFLTISAPIHDTLIAQLHAEGDRIFSNPVSKADLLRLRSRYFHRTWFDRIKGIGFDRAVKEYQEQYKKSYHIDSSGRAVFSNHNSYRQTINALLKYTPIK
ncbi:hypothetical protein [Acinetobacter sp. Ac_5812]|jgi:hypothetical protein|uniref:hypothetical protein n=1 Tax=Acinetobacter sp. Ac_5812 TaxID=1848937 RepID=UPI00148FABE8|nr:hypothetical protein [Acinetobacter sp. Ac_5812]NNP70833.1 hypothetical protein [Acinetobacter sp. Ac_5812]